MRCISCGNEYEAKRKTSKYCGPKCRKLAFQENGKVSVPGVSVPDRNDEWRQANVEQTVCLVNDAGMPVVSYDRDGKIGKKDYLTHPDMFAKRTNPEKLNWGGWMTQGELEDAGLKANRIPIPGDHDYVGCCEKVDGVWVC